MSGWTTTTVPAVTVAQMREVDRVMVDEVGIVLLQMMENAGRALALQARHMLGGPVRGRDVVVLCGSGGNGGGGMVAARRLTLWGARVTVVRDDRERPHVPEVAHQLDVLERVGAAVATDLEDRPADLVVDALVGYGLQGPLRASSAHLVQAARALPRTSGTGPVRVLALDVPSGLDADRGTPGPGCVVATATLTLALPKVGLVQPASRRHVGRLLVADISVPPGVFAAMGLDVSRLFDTGDVIEVSS